MQTVSDVNVRLNVYIPIDTTKTYDETRALGRKYEQLAANKANPRSWHDVRVFI